MNDDEREPPEAPEMPEMPEPPDLALGEPWAIAHDCELMRETESGELLTSAVIVCGQCDKPFRIDLLDDRTKGCAHCGEKYTHVLLVAQVDNFEIAPQAFEQIARMNGFGDPNQAQQSGEQSENDSGDTSENPDE